MATTPKTIMRAGQRKFYVYDSAVHAGDELGGMTAKKDDDNEDGVYVLASPMQMQYWIDQGLVGTEPKAKLTGSAKDLLKQITRGRSESEDDPPRVPKYSRQMQSGAPMYAGTLAERRRKAQKKAETAKKKDNKAATAAPKKPTPPAPPSSTPPAA